MNTLLTIIHGLAVGILVSAPMGPIGMLCIQRTLNKGRLSGLYTGIGAALSDFIYALLAGLGMSIIIDFVEDNEAILQLFGSIVLLGFGIYIARKNPAKTLRTKNKGNKKKKDYMQDLATGFLFTFSNPLILFLIIGLYARFNFPSPEFKFADYIIGFASIIIGALLWWLLITYFVNKIRGHFNVRSIWLINMTIGILICIMSVLGFIMSLIELL